jgi:hypothetical protein
MAGVSLNDNPALRQAQIRKSQRLRINCQLVRGGRHCAAACRTDAAGSACISRHLQLTVKVTTVLCDIAPEVAVTLTMKLVGWGDVGVVMLLVPLLHPTATNMAPESSTKASTNSPRF